MEVSDILIKKEYWLYADTYYHFGVFKVFDKCVKYLKKQKLTFSFKNVSSYKNGVIIKYTKEVCVLDIVHMTHIDDFEYYFCFRFVNHIDNSNILKQTILDKIKKYFSKYMIVNEFIISTENDDIVLQVGVNIKKYSRKEKLKELIS